MLPARSKLLGLALFICCVLPLGHGAFATDDPASTMQLPEGWTLTTDAAESELEVGVVSDVVRTDAKSMKISHRSVASTTLVSRPVQLVVGHVYRLRAWVRTEGVRSDPTARYPTAVPACLSMASLPFTNHSPTLGGSNDWTRLEMFFVATKSTDNIRLHLGYNGGASGTAWFDDVKLDKVKRINEYIPPETVRWLGDGYRYDDRGWIFVHIEGEPFQRGFQYGFLVANEIVAYINKLGVEKNEADPEAGWHDVRLMTDLVVLRKYDEEYLTEMQGIANGAAHAGAEVFGHKVDLLDIVAINSVIDLEWMSYGLEVTPHALSGQSFLAAEEEMQLADSQSKCSAFAATGPATADGEVVFGQIFMWGGYTGVHWNVICDVVPSQGHRLVYQTFPGGIHSGADFYINSAGIVIGETTVSQTPYEPDGTPQSNRIRKAAQYASSIDEVVQILWSGNNGMYTNDWPIADIKTSEVAILLLGTHKKKLWRSSEEMAPFGTPGFFWANNNNRDPEVRKEYAAQPEDAPYDLIFSPWNRDLAFNEFYREHGGAIDSITAVNLWATSPVSRAHACDGKITTTDMAQHLVFLAHHGKLTLRSKFPGRSGRRMPDLPGAIPHLSLGYSVASPVVLTQQLQQARDEQHQESPEEAVEGPLNLDAVADRYRIDRRRLWRDTMYPASEADSWLISGTARYWDLLDDMAEEPEPAEAARSLTHDLAELSTRFQYIVSREADLVPLATRRAYDRYGPYQIPRIKGTFALHQLRLLLGNDTFLEVMNTAHERFARTEISTREFIEVAEEVADRRLEPFIRQWIERTGFPRLVPQVTLDEAGQGWRLTLRVAQEGEPYHLLTSFEVQTDSGRQVHPIEIEGAATEVTLELDERPSRVVFNPFDDVPLARERFYVWRNFIDEFHDTLIVYGTSRQIEVNHTLALHWQERAADAYIEIFAPVVKDSELSPEQLAGHDLMVLGHPQDNSLAARMAEQLPVSFANNLFRWQGETFAEPDDGLFVVLPNPFNPERVLYLVVANSALQLYQMTKEYHRGLPSWALFNGDEVVDEGYHPPQGTVFELDQKG